MIHCGSLQLLVYLHAHKASLTFHLLYTPNCIWNYDSLHDELCSTSPTSVSPVFLDLYTSRAV